MTFQAPSGAFFVPGPISVAYTSLSKTTINNAIIQGIPEKIQNNYVITIRTKSPFYHCFIHSAVDVAFFTASAKLLHQTSY